MEIDVELRCINLTQLRGMDKFDQMVAGSFSIKSLKNSLVGDVKE